MKVNGKPVQMPDVQGPEIGVESVVQENIVNCEVDGRASARV